MIEIMCSECGNGTGIKKVKSSLQHNYNFSCRECFNKEELEESRQDD